MNSLTWENKFSEYGKIINKYTYSNNILLPCLDGLLVGDQLVAVHGDGGLATAAISGVLLKLFSKAEVEQPLVIIIKFSFSTKKIQKCKYCMR